jgi:predicted dehydrogenase
MPSVMNVGVIGLGVGATHARVFSEYEPCRLAAVCDFSEDRLNEASLAHPGVIVTTNDMDILTNPEIDLVVVASHDDDHHRQVLSALDNGKHVFAEKPLCLHRQEAEDIRDKLREHPELRMTSNLGLRTCPRFAAVREAVQRGDFGDVFSMDGDYLWGRKIKLTEGWRKEMEFYSIIYGAAVHMVDLLMWISGRKPVEVQAYGNAISTAGSGFRANDFSSLNMLFDDGCIGRVTANGGCVHPHFHGLGVFGTRKTFRHDLSGAVWLVPGRDEVERVECTEPYPARENRAEIIRSFVDALLDDSKEPMVNEQAVFDTMSVCFAAERAARERVPVLVEYIEL